MRRDEKETLRSVARVISQWKAGTAASAVRVQQWNMTSRKERERKRKREKWENELGYADTFVCGAMCDTDKCLFINYTIKVVKEHMETLIGVFNVYFIYLFNVNFPEPYSTPHKFQQYTSPHQTNSFARFGVWLLDETRAPTVNPHRHWKNTQPAASHRGLELSTLL